jgi:hypothetical protein
MAQPTWVTGSGNLGTIPEGKFYKATLEAYDPDFPYDSSKVKYVKISGKLPQGIQINSSGTLEGTPVASITGVPSAVSENVTSKFSIRVFTEREVNGSIIQDRLTDRTFNITVIGQDAPEFVTQSGELGKYFDGQLVNKQIEFTDTDPGDTAVVSIVSGELPPGITINTSGLIFGYIEPAIAATVLTAGWENVGWDSQPLQFNTGTISKSYQFTLRITDGTDYNLRTFSIYVGITTADATSYTADSEIITTDIVTQAPFISPYSADLGTFLHDNFFIYQFKGVDYNGDILNYAEGISDTIDTTFKTADSTVIRTDYTTSLPLGLELDVNTGTLHGTLSNIGLTEKSYNFSIIAYRKENPLVSNTFNYSMKVIGDVNAGVKWNTNDNLGIINNGDISTFSINASADSGTALQYRLKQGGIYNKLPQGLELLDSGNIAGRVNYQVFGLIDYNITSDNSVTIDTNLITADTNGVRSITFDNNTTSFDSKFSFTIEAYSNGGQISTFNTFTIEVNKKYNLPSHILRIDATPPQSSRNLLDTLLQNQDTIKEELLYRADDPYFGIATKVSYAHAYGLSPEILDTYIESLSLNHYDKRLILGEIKTAQALDNKGDILYEVVYSTIIDDIHGVPKKIDSTIDIVYPNSLDNMRTRVIDKVGQVSTELPTWMLSKQANGQVLGFTAAWVIAYALPGQSDLIAYSINKEFGKQLNKINFIADRYTLDAQFTQNWDAEDQRWHPSAEMTFDIYFHGDSADGVTSTADSTVVRADLVNSATIETTFDSGSCIFISAQDNTADLTNKTADTTYITADNGIKSATAYKIIDKFNKYLIFPKIDIINTKQTT